MSTAGTCAGTALSTRRTPLLRGPANHTPDCPTFVGFAEKIRRDTTGCELLAILVKLEEMAVRPCIGAVGGDEDRDIPDDFYIRSFA